VDRKAHNGFRDAIVRPAVPPLVRELARCSRRGGTDGGTAGEELIQQSRCFGLVPGEYVSHNAGTAWPSGMCGASPLRAPLLAPLRRKNARGRPQIVRPPRSADRTPAVPRREPGELSQRRARRHGLEAGHHDPRFDGFTAGGRFETRELCPQLPGGRVRVTPQDVVGGDGQR
jgi:hypothetical protein